MNKQDYLIKMQSSSSKKVHKAQLKYLVREGTNLDGSAAELFGTDREEYQKNMVGKNFRIFLTSNSSQIDVKELAEKFIAKYERQTGRQLFWQGACHYNTYPHAHLLINGVDKNGKAIWGISIKQLHSLANF